MANTIKAQLDSFSGRIASLTTTSGEKLDGIRTESATGAKQLREEVIAAFNSPWQKPRFPRLRWNLYCKCF